MRTATNGHTIDQWVNDYLDLYNFAQSIGDVAWQQEIAETLKQHEHYRAIEANERLLRDLWRSFDEINRGILALFSQMHLAASNDSQTEALRERVFELKRERLTISQKIRKIGA